MPMSRLNTATEFASGHDRPFDAVRIEAGGRDGCAIGAELHGALSVLGVVDGIYIIVADMPLGARLSAGRCNSMPASRTAQRC